ncbi:uncharacterized protein LOC125198282 [Salvia hispanica]|uniref:uncharacterized protein LOC125198282 n=1 Tax=Salvia hispanica TaxID=49212 RepID=UPI0020097576|nr:uncharacterized protein LOC125198282 [Salvia hispanica]
MVDTNGKHYVGGKVQLIDNCDSDKWSKLEVDDILEKINFDVSRLEYYYLKPGMSLDDGLMRLFDNLSSVEMAEIGVQKGVVDVFVVEANDLVVSQITQENSIDGVGGESGDEAMRSEGYEFGDEDDKADYEDCEFGKGEGIEEAAACGKGKAFENGTGKGKGKVADDDLEEDPSFIDSDYDLSDHEEDAIMAGQVEGWKKIVDEMVNDHMGDTSDSDHLPNESPNSSSEEEMEHDDNNDKLVSRRYRRLMEHDDNNDKLVSRRYRPATDLNDPRWELGIRFNCKEDFADLIRHQGVLHGKRLRLVKNDSIRCLAKCKGVIMSKKKLACPWG